MSGPLPTGEAIRRNKPTIPTTSLPVAGRSTPTPDPPMTYELDIAGRDWWEWAWHTPQACGWDDGALFAVARRAQLEDDLAALEQAGEFDWSDYLNDEERGRKLDTMLTKLKALAGNKLALVRECRELDNRLGLTPKGLADLRWKIVDDESQPQVDTPKPKRRKLTVVPDAATG